jgi:hypothetical protein
MCLQRIFALGDTGDVMPRSLAVYDNTCTSIFLVVKCECLLEDNCAFGNTVHIIISLLHTRILQ